MDAPVKNGVGEGCTLTPVGERGSVEDTRLMELAIRERWPIPEKYRTLGIERMFEVLEKSKSERERVYAFRALVAADKVNMDARREGLDVMLLERKIASEAEIARQPQQHIHAHTHRLQVCEDGDWYSNAHRLGPQADAAHGADPDESGAIQVTGVRQAVGQNGNGAAGSH